MAKKGNLKAFMLKVQAPKTSTPDTNGTPAKRRDRGHGDIVAITARMTKEDWKRLHVLALDMNGSLQSIFAEGVSMLLRSKGLPPLEPVK